MKIRKIAIVFLLIILTTFGCSSDGEDTGSDQISQDNLNKLRGTWRLVSSTTDDLEDDLSGTCKLFNSVDFYSSNSVSVNTVSGTNCSSTESQDEDYIVNGNVLTVGDTTLDILTLNTTTLKVKYRNQSNYTETYSKI